MSNIRASVFLSAATGISPGNHKYFSSDAAALSFFRGKQKHAFSGVAVARNIPSRHGYNVDAVHLPGTLATFEGCEYVSYLNADGSNRWFHNKILSVEYVNPASCRIHFTVDYYATYIGSCMGTLGRCFVIRGHVKTSEDTLNRFLLAEPVDVPMIYEGDFSANGFLKLINDQIKPDTYCVYSSSDSKQNTNTENVGIKTQGGVEIYGVVKGKTKAEVESFIKSQTAQVNTFQSMTTPMMSNVQAIKKLPSTLVDSAKVIEQETGFVPVLPSYKHKKMYSPQFFFWRLFAASSGSNQQFDTTVGVAASIAGVQTITFTFRFIMTGGLNATAALFFDKVDSIGKMAAMYVQHLPFPNITINSYQSPDYTAYGMIQKLLIRPVGAGIGGALAGEVATPVGAAVGAAIGAGGALASGVADVFGRQPATYQNAGVSTTDMALAAGLYEFVVMRYSPSDGGLKTLESFFDTWGYTLNENRAVSLNARANFTHIHTKNANVRGPVPAQALAEINNMLNAGLTVWSVEIGSTSDCGS